MNLALVFVMGLFRVIQSVNNKNVSIYTNTTRKTILFGILFEAAAAIFSLIYLFISGFGGFNLATLLCAAAMGLGFVAELLTALMCLQRAPLGLCTLCSLGGGVVLPAVAGVLFFHESLAALQWGGIVLFFVAAWLLAPQSASVSSVPFIKAIPVLLANFLINGALALMSKYYAICTADANPALFSCGSYAIATVGFAALLLKFKEPDVSHSSPFPKKVFFIGSTQGAVCATIVFLMVFLANSVPIVILNTVPSAICIAGSVFIGGLLFKEKIAAKHLLGALFSVISIALILSVPSLFGLG